MIINWIKYQLTNIRFYVLLSTSVIVIFLSLWVRTTSSSIEVANISLTEYFGLLSILYIYIALLASPIAILIPNVPYKNKLVHARRAIGVSAFIFAFLHGNIAYLYLLGGFEGILQMDPKTSFFISLGSISLWVLAALAATSFDKAIKLLTPKWWKRIQRLVYFVVFAVLIHSLYLGHNINNLNSPIPYVYTILFSTVLILHALLIEKRNTTMRKTHLPIFLAIVTVLGVILYYLS